MLMYADACSKMVRLVLLMGPIASALGGIALGACAEWCVWQAAMFIPNFPEEEEEEEEGSADSKKGKVEKWKSKGKDKEMEVKEQVCVVNSKIGRRFRRYRRRDLKGKECVCLDV
jgi:hypothetical protein